MRLALALLAFVAVEDAPAPKPVVDWLREARKHAPSVNDLVATTINGSSARVVIAGRASSGTAELAQFEGSIVSLAKASDVIALDIGPREGEEIDQWLRTGKGELDKILASADAFGWSRVEAQAWLAALAQREEKPKITGIATGDPKLACTEFLAFLGKVDPNVLPRAERALGPLCRDTRSGEAQYAQLADNERMMLRLSLEETLSLVRDAEEAYTQKSSTAEYARNVRQLVGLQQYEQLMRFEREGGEHDPRGRIMAENALAALKAGSEHTRLFALVGLRDLARASDSDSFAAQLVALGAPRAVCVGTVCGAATFRAIDPSASSRRVPRELKLTIDEAGAFERALAAAGDGAPWILDLRVKPSEASVTTWLAANGSLRSARTVCGAAGETPWDHALLADFDALAWFPALTASKLVR
jgi:hypothetical protein